MAREIIRDVYNVTFSVVSGVRSLIRRVDDSVTMIIVSRSARTGSCGGGGVRVRTFGWLVAAKIVESSLVRIILSVMYLQSAVEGYTRRKERFANGCSAGLGLFRTYPGSRGRVTGVMVD